MDGSRPIAIVTGGSRRVGRATCLELAAAGHDVVLTSHAPGDETREAAEAVESRGVAARIETLDLDDLESLPDAAARLVRSLPRLDVLVHNASVYEATPWGSIDAADLLRHQRVNVLAPLLLTQATTEALRAARGRVVAFGDIHVMGRPRRRFAAYSISKAALTELVRVLARELAPEVRVNAVAPGVVAWPEGTDAEVARRYERRIPLERSGTPEEAARAVRWLADPEASAYVTGQVLRLDGGRWLT